MKYHSSLFALFAQIEHDIRMSLLHGCLGKSEILDLVWDSQSGKKIILLPLRLRRSGRKIFLALLLVPHAVKNFTLTLATMQESTTL